MFGLLYKQTKNSLSVDCIVVYLIMCLHKIETIPSLSGVSHINALTWIQLRKHSSLAQEDHRRLRGDPE